MGEFAEDSDGLVWRANVLALGRTDDDIRRAIDSGHLQRIWTGVYVVDSVHRNADDLQRMRVIAAARSCGQRVCISHVSAALMHEMPLLKPSHDRVHMTTGLDQGGRVETRRHLHTGVLSAVDVTQISGLPVTTLERTAVDCARTGSFDEGLVAWDSALRMRADRNLMDQMLAGLRGSRGATRALRSLAVADPLSETVGESWSRAQIIACPDIPLPRLQHRFYSESGIFIARVDFDWEGRLVGEFDGLVKYGQGLMKPGQTPNDVVIAEKIREDRLRQLGVEVVRWTWSDLERGALPGIIRRALVRAGLA